MWKNTANTYGSVAKFFHWTIALLVICMLIFGYFLGDINKEYQPVAYNVHKLTGLTILTLMILRLLWRFTNPTPALPFNMPTRQVIAARTSHFLLYATALSMPIAGWVGSSAAGRPPHIGDVNLLLPVEKSEALVDTALNLHGTLAIIIIVLLSIHVLAALYHHLIKCDNILRRMLPN